MNDRILRKMILETIEEALYGNDGKRTGRGEKMEFELPAPAGPGGPQLKVAATLVDISKNQKIPPELRSVLLNLSNQLKQIRCA